MVSKKKIALMAKISAYKNYEGKKDFEVNNYFCYDYISRKNLSNIFLVIIFSTLCALIFQLDNHYSEIIVLNFASLKTELEKSIWFVVFMVIFYLFIGFTTYICEYNKKNANLNNYYENLDKLNKM